MAIATFEIGNVTIDKLTEPAGGSTSSFGDTVTAPGVDAPASSAFNIGATNATAINIGHTGLSTFIYGSNTLIGSTLDTITATTLNIGGTNATSISFSTPISASIVGNLLPSTTDAYSIGSSSFKWKDGYFSNNVAIASLTSGSVPYITTSGQITQNNANFFWDNTNTRLGIGTNAPGAKLHIVDSTTLGQIYLKSSNPSGVSQMELYNNSGTFKIALGASNSGGDTYLYTGSSTDFSIQTNNGAQKHTFKSGGTVGLGSPTPNAANRLEVSGAMTVGTYTNTVAPTNGLIVSGFVGVGTSAFTNAAINLETRNANGNAVGGQLAIRNTNSTGQSELDVFDSSANFRMSVGFDNNSISTSPNTFVYTGTSTNFRIYVNNAGTTHIFTSAGGLGLNTTVVNASNRLEVNGGTVIGSSYSNIAAPSNGLIVSGTVGIGLSNPSTSYSLDITGTASNGSQRISIANTVDFAEGLGIYSSSIVNGRHIINRLGKSATTGNAGEMFWYHSSDNSASNHIGMSFFSVRETMHLMLNGDVALGGTITPGTSTTGATLVAFAGGSIANTSGAWPINGIGGINLQRNAVTIADVGVSSSTALTVVTGKTLNLADMTTGSILFSAASGVTSQNNSKLFWDNTNFLLGLGTATPSYALELVPPATRAFVKLKAFQTADFVAIDIYNTANTAICAFAYGGSTCSVADLQNRQYTWNNGIDAMFYDGSASQTRMILKATSGNVGVGNNTSPTAFFTVTQPVITTGSPNMYQFTGGAHTTLTASTEAIDGYYKLDRSVQFNTGALTTQRAMYISAPTYRFVGSSTITNAATLAIGNAPQQGTNATITNAYALWVQAGTSLFGSNVVISGSNSTPESLTLQKGNNGSDVTIQWNNTSAVAKAWVGVIGTATDFVNEGIADDFFIRAQSNLLFTTNTSGVERMRITSDGALQVRASTAAVSTSSTGSVRYNSTAQRLQISENAGAYASLPSTPVSANDTQLTTTSPTVVATFTPATSGNYIVYVYYRVVTASTDITVNLSWTDGSGSNSVDLVPITTQPVGTYIPEQTYINSTASAITVTVTAGTANQVFVSSNIMRL